MIDRRRVSPTGFRSGPRFFRMASAAVTAALGAAVCLSGAAQAAPLPVAKRVSVESQVLQVRDGCGRGMRYSQRRDGCVEDFDDGPRGYDDRRPPPPDYDRRPPPPDYDRRPPPPPPQYDRGPGYRGEPRGPDCGPGLRFSNSRQACVRIEGAVEQRGNDDAATAAIVGSVVGAMVGSAISNDNRR